MSNVALNILNSLPNVKTYSADYSNVLELIDSDQLEVKHIARCVLKAILNGYAEGLCNLLTIGVELERSLAVIEDESIRDNILEMAEKVVDDDYYQKCFDALFNEGSYPLEQALEVVTNDEVNLISSDIYNPEQEVGEYYADCCLYDLPDIAKRYFDYEAYGRDIMLEGEFYVTDNGIFEVIR